MRTYLCVCVWACACVICGPGCEQRKPCARGAFVFGLGDRCRVFWSGRCSLALEASRLNLAQFVLVLCVLVVLIARVLLEARSDSRVGAHPTWIDVLIVPENRLGSSLPLGVFPSARGIWWLLTSSFSSLPASVWIDRLGPSGTCCLDWFRTTQILHTI